MVRAVILQFSQDSQRFSRKDTEILPARAQGCRGELDCLWSSTNRYPTERREAPSRVAGFGSRTDEAPSSLFCYCQESLVIDQSNLFQVPPWHCCHCFHCIERQGGEPSSFTRRDVTVTGCWNVVSAQFSQPAQSFLHPAHLLLPSWRNIQAKSIKHCSSLFSLWKSACSSWRNSC